jgi:hypothetical protein
MRKPDHLAFIRTLPCLICGNDIETEACHIKMADARILKPLAGSQKRAPDWFTVPMCSKHHREQHKGSERQFWLMEGIDVILMALALYAESGNYENCTRIINESLRQVYRQRA